MQLRRLVPEDSRARMCLCLAGAKQGGKWSQWGTPGCRGGAPASNCQTPRFPSSPKKQLPD